MAKLLRMLAELLSIVGTNCAALILKSFWMFSSLSNFMPVYLLHFLSHIIFAFAISSTGLLRSNRNFSGKKLR